MIAGGGIYFEFRFQTCVVVVRECYFARNDVMMGGGLNLEAVRATVTIESCVFERNYAYSKEMGIGGGADINLKGMGSTRLRLLDIVVFIGEYSIPGSCIRFFFHWISRIGHGRYSVH